MAVERVASKVEMRAALWVDSMVGRTVEWMAVERAAQTVGMMVALMVASMAVQKDAL